MIHHLFGKIASALRPARPIPTASSAGTHGAAPPLAMRRPAPSVARSTVALLLLGLGSLWGCPARAAILPLSSGLTDNESPQINASGEVVWQGWDGHDWESFLWNGTSVQPFPWYGVTSLPDGDGDDGDDVSPQINDNGQVFWQHWDRGYWQVLYMPAPGSMAPIWTGSAVVPYTTNALNHVDPRISNGSTTYLVWQAWDGGTNHWRLRRSTSAGGTVAIPNTPAGDDDVNPQVNNSGQVAWQHWDTSHNCWQIEYCADGVNATAITTGYGDNTEVQINSGSPTQLTWQWWDGSNWEIKLWNSQNSQTTTLSAASTNNMHPQINSYGNVVWQYWDGAHWQIYYNNGSGPTPVSNSITNGGDNTHPQINDHGSYAWEGWDGANWQILLFDTAVGRTQQITADGEDNRFPRLNNASPAQVAYVGSDGIADQIFLYSAGALSVTLSPSTVAGGAAALGVVTLASPAGTGGATVSLGSDNAAAVVPMSVVIPAATSTGTFTVTTTAPAAAATAHITATYAGTASAVLTIQPISPATLTLSPATVAGTASSTGTITLNAPAPAGGTAVSLAVSPSGSNVTVPASATVPAGQTSITFPITTTNPASQSTFTISAAAAGVTQQSVLTVLPHLISTLTLNPTTVVGGNPSTGTITLNAAAPSGGATVTLSSSNASAASAPPAVVVPAGSTSATFPVTTAPALSPPASVTITGSYYGGTQSATLNLQAATVVGLTIGPTSIVGANNGVAATGTVTLSGPAPSGGLSVGLSSNNVAASVSSPAIVPAGSSSTTFSIGAGAVSSTQVATITATLGSSMQMATLTIQPSTFTLGLSPTSVVGGSGSSTGTVTLSAAAPAGGATITLTTDNAAVTTLPSPPSITIPQGSTTGNFTVTTSAVTDNEPAVITATYNGASQSSTLTVTAPALSAVTVTPVSLVGGSGVTGAVTLTGPAPAGGATVILSSSNPAAASVPAMVTVPQGQTSASFTVGTSPVAASTSVTITATRLSVTQSAALTVQPPALVSLALNPSTIKGGSVVVATVTLSDPAPAGGAVVTLSSNNIAVAAAPTSVTVPAGATTATFKVTTYAVGSNTAAIITAIYQGANQQQTLTVTP